MNYFIIKLLFLFYFLEVQVLMLFSVFSVISGWIYKIFVLSKSQTLQQAYSKSGFKVINKHSTDMLRKV